MLTIMSVMCAMQMSAQSHTLTISVQEARFTGPALRQLVKEYNKVNPDFRAEVVLGNGDADATVALSAQPADYSVAVGRFVVLPVANAQSELLHHKKVQRGLTGKLRRQLYVERDVVEALEAQENGEKPLPGTVYTLCGSRAVTAQVLANSLQVPLSRFRGKKVLGREEQLLQTVQSHSDAVSYNVATLVYDTQSRRPVDGLAVLPTDLDGNGRVSDEERQAITTLDALTDFLERQPKTTVPTGTVTIETANADVRHFVNWLQTDGQHLLGAYGLLPVADALTAQK
ncbi:MAG: hypothetical protein IJ614_09495 [Prevotella sp.]|nr:hypothetical protein [Prevotella sp.]